MKAIRPISFAAGVILAATVLLMAQTGAPRPKTQGPVNVQDGGTSQTLESIFIPPMAGAPFTCILHTEWVQFMADGGTMTLVNQRRIARQGNGRFYQERWLLVPKNGQMESQMSHTQVADPNNHTLYTCVMGPNVCSVTGYGGTTKTVYRPAEVPTGPLPNGIGYITNESLGGDRTLGIDTVRTRVTKTINAWVIGNDREIKNTREFWFAPSLGINLISKVSDPRYGSQTFTVSDLVLGEPDEQLFAVPKDFQVRDERVAAALH